MKIALNGCGVQKLIPTNAMVYLVSMQQKHLTVLTKMIRSTHGKMTFDRPGIQPSDSVEKTLVLPSLRLAMEYAQADEDCVQQQGNV